MIYQMFYTSAMTPDFTHRDLNEVLMKSQHNNAKDELSGLLITHQRQFFQCLEGPKSALERCFARIARDPRHMDLAIVGKGYAAQRSFEKWRMAYQDPQNLPSSVQDVVFSLYDLVPPGSADRSDDVKTQKLLARFLETFENLDLDAA